MNIWKKCDGHQHIKSLNILGWRVVEAQHKSTTRSLVDTAEEHEILEALIESSKPRIKSGEHLHYLLFTPFRYPPLKHGSRFGTAMESSLWYGSKELKTAFSEVAYYRLVFMADTEAQLNYIHVLLTAYSVNIQTKKAVYLEKEPFIQYRSKISSPNDYSKSQEIGRIMRNADVQAFTYFLARAENNGINIAAFSPEVFTQTKPEALETWKCIGDKNSIEFIREGSVDFHRETFSAELFDIKNVA